MPDRCTADKYEYVYEMHSTRQCGDLCKMLQHNQLRKWHFGEVLLHVVSLASNTTIFQAICNKNKMNGVIWKQLASVTLTLISQHVQHCRDSMSLNHFICTTIGKYTMFLETQLLLLYEKTASPSCMKLTFVKCLFWAHSLQQHIHLELCSLLCKIHLLRASQRLACIGNTTIHINSYAQITSLINHIIT